MIFYNLDFNKIKRKDVTLKRRLIESDNFEKLINTSGINNIPNINILTTNLNVAKASNCANNPLNIGMSGTVEDCIKLCANSNTSLITVNENDEFYYNSTKLQTGNNCILGERPLCDTQTTIVLMTINSIICKPKFPNIVAGPLGTTIVACNNRMINDPQNILWDYKYNRKFDPLTTTIQSEDELLQDNNYRFRCKFNGLDERNNRYQQHPYDRFHPVKNYCAHLIYAAHPDVKTIYDTKTNTLMCDCGNKNETRVSNLIPTDKSTPCSDKIIEIRNLVRNKKELTLIHKCFNLFSPITDVGKYLPCSDTAQFIKEGSQTESLKIQFAYSKDENDEYAIEHPIFDKMKTGKLDILQHRKIC